MNKTKRVPEAYQPPDCQLHCIATYAVFAGLSPARIYQLFQEGKVTIVEVDGRQFVQQPKQ